MISILTPTYNRAYILHNAYRSLCMQTNLDFEWIIIDDGSKDNTAEVISNWQSSNLLFKIIYQKQENGGKHRAVNRGVLLASCDYILILDSDDYLVDNAVSLIHQWIKTIEGKKQFAGVAGLKGMKNTTNVIGGAPKKNYIDATNIERVKYNLWGDKAEIYKTEILRKYPFPEFEGELFLRESASWDRIAKSGYKIRWFNEIIYICEYLNDGLTKKNDRSRYKNNFNGFTFCTKLYVEIYPFPYNFLKIGYYSSIAKKLGKNRGEICKLLDINNIKFYLGKGAFFLNNVRKQLMKYGVP